MDISALRKLLFPVSLLLLGLLLRPHLMDLDAVYHSLLIWLPYASLGATLLLCIFFNDSRLFTASLAMMLAYYLVQTWLQTALLDGAALLIYTSIGFSIPLVVLVLLFITERGLKNHHGASIISIIALQFLAVLALFYFLPASVVTDFINRFIPLKPYAGYVLSLPASGAYLLVVLAGIYQLLRHNEETVAALIGVLMFSYLTMAFFDVKWISTVMFSACGISTIISMLHNSYNMAFRDELTGLLGRRALNDRLKGLGKQYVIAMVDVDHFKKFNDTWGHDTGDDVLKMVAKRIDAVAGGGTAYRYGGEEFCIVFSGKTAEDCIPFLEVVRKSVENHRMVVRNAQNRPKSAESGEARRGRRTATRGEKTVRVTVSIGVAERNEHLCQTDEVLKAADAALYIAKKDGRNCIRMPED